MAQSRRLKALQNLQQAMPVANQQIAQGMEAARGMGLQQAIATAPSGVGQRQAQQMGAGMAAQAGQQQVGMAQKEQQQQTQLAGQAATERKMEQQREQAGAERGLKAGQMENQKKIAALGEDVKNQILDSRLEFQRDEKGRTYLNERKLADYAMANAKSEEEWKDYAQTSQQAFEKKIQLLETGHKKITQALKQGYLQKKGDMDQALEKELLQAKQKIEQDIQNAKDEAANKNTMWSMGGKIAGGIAGGIATGGTPQGIMAGASLGEGIGSMAGSQV